MHILTILCLAFLAIIIVSVDARYDDGLADAHGQNAKGQYDLEGILREPSVFEKAR